MSESSGMRERRVALITGGLGGIGQAIARRLADDDVEVFVSDIQEAPGAGTTGRYLRHDVRDEASWARTITSIEAEFGRLDILVNNAALLNRGSNPEHTELVDWTDMFAVNVNGVFLGCRAAIKAMRCRVGGVIVNMGSMAGSQANPNAFAYAATKATVRHMTRTIAEYCALERLDIRCNAVHPGYVLTDAWRAYADGIAKERGIARDVVLDELAADVPIGRFVDPSEIADAVAYLCSSSARSMTGADLVIDGGFLGCNTFHHPANERRRSRS